MNLDASSSLKNLTCENAIFQHLLWFVYSFIWFLWVLFLLLLYFAAMTCPKLAHSVCLRPGMPPFMGPGMPPMPPGCAVCSVSFCFKAVTLYNEHFHFRHVNNFRSYRVKPYEFNIIVCSSVTTSLHYSPDMVYWKLRFQHGSTACQDAIPPYGCSAYGSTAFKPGPQHCL